VDEAALNCSTLKLLLQPLIENAIFHGIEPAGGHGTIDINVFLKDGNLIMEIKDDGIGNIEITGKVSKGYGIHNINKRIKFYYGENYGLELFNAPIKGTVARIVLPIRIWREENGNT
jgi:two-component system sensor histidine kinase YesM